jgi:hypothetical protein
MYHLFLPLKYRRKAITASVGKTLKAICLGIEERYEIFLRSSDMKKIMCIFRFNAFQPIVLMILSEY